MQIREKGKKLLFIRTEYKSEMKRTIGVTVASQEIGLSTVSNEVRQQLTKEEVDQLEKWLSDRTEKQSVDSLKNGLSMVSYFARRASKSLTVESVVSGLSTEDANEIWLSMAELGKALKKAGFPKPKPIPVEKAQDDKTGQLPLDR